MVQKLDEFLKGFAGEEDYTDYWYDEGFSIAQDIINKILLQFLESEDKELIELTVDSLRTFINQKNKSILLENPIFMDQVKSPIYSG